MPNNDINDTNDIFSNLRLSSALNFGVATPLTTPEETKGSTGLFVQAVALLQADIYLGNEIDIGMQFGPYIGASGLNGAVNDVYGFSLGTTTRLKNNNVSFSADTYLALQRKRMNETLPVDLGFLLSSSVEHKGLKLGAFIGSELRLSEPGQSALILGLSMIMDIEVGE